MLREELVKMNREYGDGVYSTVLVQDDKDGFAGLELYCASWGKKERIASVLFWEANGEFFVETYNRDVPLEILEELIVETKERIKIR
jgi:hypothetical protein